MTMSLQYSFSSISLSSPTPELYGALLRLREWLNANIYFITEHESVTDKVDDRYI